MALGVLMEKNNTVKAAGGLIVQALPGASDEQIEVMEQRLSAMPPITSLLDEGRSPEDILGDLLGDLDLQINDSVPTAFKCNCNKQRVEKVVISLGRKELGKIVDEGEPIELRCHFCNKAYEFTADELKKLYAAL